MSRKPRTPRPLAVGDTVRHFTNPDSRAEIIAVQPMQDCGEFGRGNWNRGAFFRSELVLVRWPNGRQEWEFGTYYTRVSK